MLVIATILLLTSACSDPAANDDALPDATPDSVETTSRRYSATWTIDIASVSPADADITAPIRYLEVVDDAAGRYLVQSPDHLALQDPDQVVFCAAISRLPYDPFCAASPRSEGAPYVLSYPIQLLREWSPSKLYDLASYRELSLVAASDPENWSVQSTATLSGIPIECFLVTGETSAANTGFEVCYTDDDLHLVASVDLQRDLVFEIDLLDYERIAIAEDFETSIDDFIEERPMLQEQLLDLYPEIPAPRPTPTPAPEEPDDG